jgi:recombination protein RecR
MPTRTDKNPLDDLEGLLRKLPGVGEKSARRLAIFIAKAHEQYSQQLAAAILSVRRKVRECRRCRNFGEQELCAVCSDPKRERDVLCVVAGVQDLQSIERSHSFRGVYYVLHGHLSPLDGIGPDDLQVERLEALIREDGTREVIASGGPHGGELEYTDPVSIKSSISGRREY